ncbi:hypothetical protein V1Y59_15230 [Gordonia sp. PKS22-38]|uniref:Uncharacterized protein n=1 Tax=Gordonia prachuapensis TaxID=3115651 RepID=A0ABU7MVS4_9ACTN|nr:hypothetical protein [Gordonia sp. PKS22-38]
MSTSAAFCKLIRVSGFEVDTDGAELLEAGRLLATGSTALVEAIRVLCCSTLFLERPRGRYANLNVYTVRGDEWVIAFSTLNRLVNALGPCQWIALTGRDLMDNMPPGVNLGIDIQDDHSFSVPSALIAAQTFTRNGEGL